jgi:hypothetical protein
MHPTLAEPDLLEVQSYGAGRVRRGDVVFFKSPVTGTMTVHRVVSVGRGVSDGRPGGDIRTRGDNCTADDPWILQAEDIIGRVTAARRGIRRRKVHGGALSVAGRRSRVVVLRAIGHWARLLRARIPLPVFRLPGRLLPRSLRPRLVQFDARDQAFLKLLMGRQTVGQYDDRLDLWRFRRPFHLFVDERALREAGVPARSKEAGD